MEFNRRESKLDVCVKKKKKEKRNIKERDCERSFLANPVRSDAFRVFVQGSRIQTKLKGREIGREPYSRAVYTPLRRWWWCRVNPRETRNTKYGN